MTLASSGFLSMGGTTAGRSINLELGKNATTTIGLNDSDARELANVFSGNISVADFYGKTFYTFGQEEFTTPGTFNWICPQDVATISVICIGGGGGGDAGSDLLGVGGGGGGGALAYRNNISVIPGQAYSITVGSGGVAQVVINGTTISDSADGEASSAFSCIAGGGKKGTRASGDIVIGSTSAAGGTIAGIYSGGYAGGVGGTADTSSVGFRVPGGGGAAGYSGIGGTGARGSRPPGTPTTSAGRSGTSGAGGGGGGGGSGYSDNNIRVNTGGNGGGVGIYGEGASGTGGVGGSRTNPATDGGDGSGGSFGYFGAGGSGGIGGDTRNGRDGIPGAVRIIWPGILRRFPNTRTENV